MTDRPEQQRSLIGRAGEVAALTRAISAACSGGPGWLLVGGPAGIGKSALVEHAIHRHRALSGATPPRVLRVAGVPWESDLPLGIAEQLLRALGADPDLADPASSHAVLETGRLLTRQWTARQERQPLIVVVEDAHWADVESLRAMRSAVRRMSNARVLVLLVAREEPYEKYEVQGTYEDLPAPLLRTLEFLDSCQDDAQRLGPLTPQDVCTLAREVQGVSLDLPAARHLCHHTLGNPRHVSQLLRELPRETWQDWRPELPAPARYAAAVRERLARCGESARRLVEACSVLGDDATLAEAAELADVDEPLPAVDEARSAALLTATIDPGRAQLTFVHPLARAAILTGIDLTRRAGLHRRAAEIIEDYGRQLTHRVAATTTADEPLAGELDRYAVERASAGEWSIVADTLVRAGRLTAHRATREDRLLRAVDAMIGAGDVPQAAAFAAELESFPAGILRDVVLGYLAIMRGRPAEAETFLTDAWQLCDPKRHPDLMAMICQRRVLHALGHWDGRDMVTWARRAVELADPDDPSAIESEAVLGLGLAAMGRPEEALAAYEAAASTLPGGAQPQRFQLGRGWVDLAFDAPEAARRRLEAALPTGYRMGSTRISLWAQGWLARTQFALGAWPEALETVQRAAARLADVSIELVRPMVHWTGAQINALRGDWDAADHHVGEAAADFHHYEVMLIPACLARAQVAEARGDYDRVVEALAPVVQLTDRESVDEPGFWPWPDVYANALVMTGRVDAADAFLSPHEHLAALRARRSAMARLGLARGRITAARGDIDTARKEFEQALGHLEHLPLPYDRARVNFAYGQTLRRAGKRREADTVLKNARDTYTTLGARTYVERCDRELQAVGLHTSRLTPGMSQLTAQEQAVARLVASGATNQQAALELFISVKTVQYHLTHVYAKLGIRSRSELAARFRELPS
ncbi:LuxR family transcriptional regulator [Streptomyces hygroscopicus]|uniref:helix-turn-helix transcriptional regulator n=1 Tax=Streptomyces hygroscopicus TaxID=1912 RepID=UPI00223FFA2C|nr:LuxR family transcriptional regulator [Streptomyces hygroscopicus]MCW7945695.1 LuxR family transcriptional regulator [Streptomyces hygroscopicus]